MSQLEDNIDKKEKNGLSPTPNIKESRSKIIQAVQTPLGFFVFVVLIVEAILGIVTFYVTEIERSYLIHSMIYLIFFLVIIVAGMAFFRPRSLFGENENIKTPSDQFDIIALNISSLEKKIETSVNIIQDYRYTKDNLLTIADILHSYHHEYRNVIFKIYEALSNKNFNIYKDIDNIFRTFISSYMINGLVQLFSNLTNDNCMVSIEHVENSESKQTNAPYKISLFDCDFNFKRKLSKKETFYHTENLAFTKILQSKNEYLGSEYLSNNLINDNFYCQYDNWKNVFNACQIVAVRTPPTTSDKLGKPIAFICIYNRKGNFDEKITYNFLSAITDSYYFVLTLYKKYMKETEKITDEMA